MLFRSLLPDWNNNNEMGQTEKFFFDKIYAESAKALFIFDNGLAIANEKQED